MGWRRPVVAMAAGLVAGLVVVISLGLPSAPAGAGDNGDGYRLYCGAGLAPATPDGRSNWEGGVVLDFTSGSAPCSDPIASSALPILRLATTGAGPVWSLSRLGFLYALAIAVAAAVAAWAVGPGVRMLVLVPAVVPLAGPTFSRFFVSTFGEPAGLLGACVLCLGAGVLAVTDRRLVPERIIGLVLVAGGGLLAATAKTAYVPLLGMAVLICAATAVRTAGRKRVAGPVVAVVALLLAVAPVLAGVGWQQRNYAVVNAHNLVFTVVLPEVGDDALVPLGLPAAAAPFAGRAYFPEGADGYPGSEVVAARPGEVRSAAYRELLTHPGAALRAFGTGLEATLGARLDYLPSQPLTATTVPPVLGSSVGEQGADRGRLLAWLDSLPVPWLPAVVALVGVVAGLIGRTAFTRIAALGGASAVGLVVVAVLGDGYFEIAKHVWLAAYLLEVAAAALVLAAAAALLSRRRSGTWDTAPHDRHARRAG
ncbi:hypothetical protein [Pseudonocardia sp. 73-21]|uniref:glycan biosynthesis hexose transferase WsfD n=1 Tax=Pseudonocardia sp. 73-21 TaxID=1895809 RepID=UPI000AFD291F|nr:hypothetical protein [Pseudonocardia sp. 73-21]